MGVVVIFQGETEDTLSGSTPLAASITSLSVFVAWYSRTAGETPTSAKRVLLGTRDACLLAASLMVFLCTSPSAYSWVLLVGSCIMYPASVLNVAEYKSYQFQNHKAERIPQTWIATAQAVLQTGVGFLMGPLIVRTTFENNAENSKITKLLAAVAAMQVPLMSCLWAFTRC